MSTVLRQILMMRWCSHTHGRVRKNRSVFKTNHHLHSCQACKWNAAACHKWNAAACHSHANHPSQSSRRKHVPSGVRVHQQHESKGRIFSRRVHPNCHRIRPCQRTRENASPSFSSYALSTFIPRRGAKALRAAHSCAAVPAGSCAHAPRGAAMRYLLPTRQKTPQ